MLYNVDSDHSVLLYLFYTYKKKSCGTKKEFERHCWGEVCRSPLFLFLSRFKYGIACIEPLSYRTEKAVEVACTFQFLF